MILPSAALLRDEADRRREATSSPSENRPKSPEIPRSAAPISPDVAAPKIGNGSSAARLGAVPRDSDGSADTRRGVYFLEAGDTGLVKIGKADHLGRRLKQIQPYCPHPLNVLAVGLTVGDSRDAERKIHERFAHYRLHGEWFHLSSSLRTLIAHVAESGRIPRRLCKPSTDYYAHERQKTCKHPVVRWNEKEEPFRGSVDVVCRSCGILGQMDRQPLLLEALRRKHGRIPPLPLEQTQEAA